MSIGRSMYSKMRSNSASDASQSAPTPSRDWIGKSRRVCRVVNATTVPMRSTARQSAARRTSRSAPASRRRRTGSCPSSSGPPCASAPRDRRCRSDSAVNRSARSSPRPIVLPSMIPETESDSATSALRVGEAGLLLGRDLAPELADAACHPHRGRHEEERNDGQRPSRMHIATTAAITVVAFGRSSWRCW